ncbi:MAG: hypothetical protein MJY62_06275 [Bacteroidales bacterium]|nr:hypothetical protein [Bacteroidales bacterium]
METNQKKFTIAAVIAAVLAIVLAVVLVQKGNLVKELKSEKAELTEQITALQHDYDTLKTESDSLRAQLEASQEECAQLVEKVKVTEATDRSKIRRYEKELGNLRAQLKKYVAEIDSLNAANKQLTEERDAARAEAAANQEKVNCLTATVNDLEGKVAVGSVVKAHNITAIGVNAKGRMTVRAKKTVRIVTTMTLLENELAAKGAMNVYVRVLDKDNNLITNGTPVNFTYKGAPIQGTAVRDVDYEGNEVELSVYATDITLEKGIYSIEAYTDKGQLGIVELLVR